MISERTSSFIAKYKYQIGLFAIIVIAAFMRFYKLDALPPGLHPDEAANGLDIFKILEHHAIQPFFPANGGREGLFFYLQAIPVAIFGNTTLALRLAPATIGVLATIATYLWISKWFSKRTGIIAAFLMAVTPWAVTISRDGFRAGMVALMVPLTLWLAAKAFESRKAIWFALAGFSFGLGFYTYISYRLFALTIIAGGFYILLWRRQWLAGRVRGIVIAAIVTGFTLVPMGLYALHHPADLFSRAGGVSVTNPDLNHGNLPKTLAETTIKTAGMFNIHGDENYRQNFGGAPEFNVFVGLMFLLGVFIALSRIKRLRYFMLLATFVGLLLPEVLTAEGIPHALRAIGALPAALGLAAIGIGYMMDSWYRVFPLNTVARFAGTIAVVLLMALSAYHGYVQYFVAWGNSQETYDAYSEDASAVAKYYNEAPFTGTRYLVGGGYGMQPVEFLTHKKATYTLVDAKKVDSLPIQTGTTLQFTVMSGDRDKVIKSLKAKYPKGKASPHYSPFSGDELFTVYTVPAS